MILLPCNADLTVGRPVHDALPLKGELAESLGRGGLGGFADAVDGRAGLLERFLDPTQAVVDRAPAGVDQLDDQAEVVDARAALGEELGLDALKPADRLVGEPAYLGELTGDRAGLGADALADGVADLAGERRLELGGRLRERLDLGACALQGGVHVGRRRLSLRRVCESFAGALESLVVHDRDDSVSAG